MLISFGRAIRASGEDRESLPGVAGCDLPRRKFTDKLSDCDEQSAKTDCSMQNAVRNCQREMPAKLETYAVRGPIPRGIST